MHRIQIVDSHTGGEPTRVIVAGGPELGSGTLAQRREILAAQFDWLRSVVINEPRGSDVLVGALVCPPVESDSTAGVIFFNNTGYLNMCGHATIGLMVTLAHLNRIAAGRHVIETPVGPVCAELLDGHRVRFENVAAYRLHQSVTLETLEVGRVTGDVAWGGNWFFLTSEHGRRLSVECLPSLLEFTRHIRNALQAAGITGRNGAEIDHIQLTDPADSDADSRSFVLCPGGAWDRSPCGTGTSAKLACLAADGLLKPGQVWRQESIIGSVFEGRYQTTEKQIDGQPVILPEITGSAWVTSSAELLIDSTDPFRHGITL